MTEKIRTIDRKTAKRLRKQVKRIGDWHTLALTQVEGEGKPTLEPTEEGNLKAFQHKTRNKKTEANKFKHPKRGPKP